MKKQDWIRLAREELLFTLLPLVVLLVLAIVWMVLEHEPGSSDATGFVYSLF